MAKKTSKMVPAYEVSITLKKFFYELFIVAAIASLTWYMTSGIELLTLEFPQYIGILSFSAAIVAALINYLKNHNKTKEI